MIRVSWSIINNYSICGMKVFYELRNTPHPLSWAMAGGDIAHEALKSWAHDNPWEDTFEEQKQQWVGRTVDQKDWNGEFTDTAGGTIQLVMAKELVKKYIKGVEGKPNKELVELNLTKDLGDGVILSGRIDSIWPDGRIVDWKVSSSPRYFSPIQAICYAILNGGPSKFEYHGMIKARSPYWDVFPVKQTEKQENLDRVVETRIKPVAKAIEQGIFPANPEGKLCRKKWCGYWRVCEGRFT